MQWISNAVSAVGNAIDKAQDALVPALLSRVEPEVHQVIDTRTDQFRDATLADLPSTAVEQLRGWTEDTPAAWLVQKAVGDGERVQQLLSRLVESLRPGVNNATDGLSVKATRIVVDQLRDMLTDEEDKAASTAATAGGAEGGGFVQRDLPMPDQAPDTTDRGFSGFSLARFIQLDERMPGWELYVRQLAHPLFEQLEEAVWQLVPDALQGALLGGPEEQQQEVQEGGRAGRIIGWLSETFDDTTDRALRAAVAAGEGPLRALVRRLVAELESSAMAAALLQVRTKLADFRLLSRDMAAPDQIAA